MTGRFSPFVIKALVDAITGGAGNDTAPPVGIYRSGPKIEEFFLDCGFDMHIGAVSRTPATLAALRQMAARPEGDELIKRVILKVCDPREYLSDPEKSAAVREHINRALEADGLAVTVVGGKAHLTDRQGGGVIVEPFISKVAVLDFDTVQVEVARAIQNATDDPEDCVTAACSLVEAVCRSILLEMSLPLPAKKDVDDL